MMLFFMPGKKMITAVSVMKNVVLYAARFRQENYVASHFIHEFMMKC